LLSDGARVAQRLASCLGAVVRSQLILDVDVIDESLSSGLVE
jgi:hypothetical protein